jgi:hypothetical protein
MRKVLSIILALLVATSFAIALTIQRDDITMVKDNSAVRLGPGKADTSARYSLNQTKCLVFWFGGYTVVADSAAKCSLFVDLYYGNDNAPITKTGPVTAADSTGYRFYLPVDTLGAMSFRYRIKTDSRGDSLVMTSGFTAVPLFLNR